MAQTSSSGADSGAASASASLFTAPQLSLPKGGGALRDIGDKFSANPVTGTGSLTVPLATSPGRSGFGPQLSLSYDSGIGNGPFGLGWSLSLPSITRRTDKGLPRYNDCTISERSDIFVLSGAEDLVPVLRQDADGCWNAEVETKDEGYRVEGFRPRTEGLFARIERWTCLSTGMAHWRSISRDNVLTVYGLDAASRIADPCNPLHVFTWLICRSYDDKGNAIVYDYEGENSANVDPSRASERNRLRSANRYLKRVRYGNRRPVLLDPAQPGFRTSHLLTHDLDAAAWMFSLVLDYGEGHYAEEPCLEDGRVFAEAACAPRHVWPVRADPFSSFRAGFEVRTYRLCRRALMFHHFPHELGADDVLVKSTSFTYRQEPFGSFIERIVQAGHKRQGDGRYLTRAMPSLDLDYIRSPLQTSGDEGFTPRDVDPESLANLPNGVDGTIYRWLDLDGEGIAGILAEQGGAWLYKHNLGEGHFGATETVKTQPALTRSDSALHHLMDVAGDGNLDLVDLSTGVAGFYGRTLDAGWKGFQAFHEMPVLNWNDANLRFVDLTGDGIADVLITEDDAFTWHPSRLEEGFGAGIRVKVPLTEEETGPRAIFSDPKQTIYLADMTGDGLADIVRIRNGEVCYWPNSGYGRFAAKVTMDRSPRFDETDVFDQRRIRLADTDGAGTTDIIYLGRDGVRIYLNFSGNALSEARRINEFPLIDNVAAVTVADLLGRGTACLVWSSPLPREAGRQLRYIDLMCGRKPHLLAHMTNNMGASTRIDYASSTECYLADKRAGTPWVTRLPFPVHVVRRVEIHDAVSRNRIVTRYSYHHGFFDGLEREFRGFGRVDQLDTEDVATFQAAGGWPAENWGAESNVPPVLTKTWFHTGVFLGGGGVSRHLAHEYFAPPDTPVVLADTILPRGLTAFEAREAGRSLKGMMLRQEVYGLDGSAQARTPYSTTESNGTIVPLQPKGDNRYAVFFTHAREAISVHYERRADDPRINHSFTLAVDDYGNVLRSVAIGYQRRRPDYDEQAVTLATLTENTVTNAVREADAYRTPLPTEAKSYELTAAPLCGAEILSFAMVAALSQAAREIAYEATPTPGETEKRLIEHARSLYRRNDLAALLPLGMLQSLALPGESYKQALTPGLLNVFAAKASATDLCEILASREAGYRDIDGSGPFWIPTGRVFYAPEPTESSGAELHFALKHFYLPHLYRDPFGHDTVVGYDEHDLAAVFTRDAVGNEAHAALDYRVLQPYRLTDPNGNRAEARFDALGMLAGTALRGKVEGPIEGDSFDAFITDLPPEEVRAYFDTTNPRAQAVAHLGTATSRVIYDLHRVPACTASIARETHVSALAHGEQTRVQLQFAYSDGFGRIAQRKMQAEPGPLDIDDEDSRRADPRWVGTGATVFNNKGKPIRQYEPFFSATPKFGIERWGVSNVLFYDPLDRIIATLHPDHTFEKVVFDTWRQITYDANDTVLLDPESDPDVGHYIRLLPDSDYLPTWYQKRIGDGSNSPERQAAEKAARHADTPSTVHFDSLGRPFLSVANNGKNKDGEWQFYSTRTTLDIEGNQRLVTDALGRIVMRYEYDMLGTRLRQRSMEAGDRWMLSDVVGKTLRVWNERGYTFRTDYDALHRPVRNYVRGGKLGDHDCARECLFSRTTYGDSAETGLSKAERWARNLGTKPYRHFDGAGVATNDRYDFKGNALGASRQFTEEFREPPDWTREVRLEFEKFCSVTAYDALSRATAITAPDGSVYRPRFNDASLLEAADVNIRGVCEQGRPVWSSFVRHINYDAKGQRSMIRYGNGAVTEYEYERTTFRLTRLKTERACGRLDGMSFKHADKVQDLHYTYDPVGNITRSEDMAFKSVFHANHRVDATADYTYDPLYRLLEATGREHAAQSAFSFAPAGGDYRDFPFVGAARLHDLQALRSYCEYYTYDPVGNFLRLRHEARGGNFERDYVYDSPSLLEPGVCNNRLSHSSVRDGALTLTERYHHDAHGNMIEMPHLPHMDWDFQDQLHEVRRRVVNHGVSEATVYVYDASGQRARKITLREDGKKHCERYYLGGFEILRSYNAKGLELQRETLHVMDDKQRIALIDTRVVGQGQPIAFVESAIRYQLSNHLGSACLELDSGGAVLTYEEYSPYGNSTFQAGESAEVSLKRYRYTGKERDEENGFTYHGARYYAPWLGRWTACDPKGTIDGVNLYAYASGRATRLVDLNGHAGQSPPGLIGDHKKYADLWEKAAQSVLKNKLGLKGETFEENLALFGKHINDIEKTVGKGSNRAKGTAINVSRETYKSVRSIFGKLAKDAGISLDGVQVHHAIDPVAVDPTQSLNPWNLNLAAGNAGTKGTPHNKATEAYESVKDRLAAFTAKNAKTAADGEKTAEAVVKTESGVAVGAKIDKVLAAGADLVKAESTLSKVISTGGKVLKPIAKVAGVVGKIAAPLAVAADAVQVFTAKNGTDRATALADTLAGAAAFTGPVGEAFAGGYAVGGAVDKGIEFVSKKTVGVDLSPSNGIAHVLTAADEAYTNLTADPSKPAYTQTLGWKLANWLDSK